MLILIFELHLISIGYQKTVLRWKNILCQYILSIQFTDLRYWMRPRLFEDSYPTRDSSSYSSRTALHATE